ncbi:MAG: MFS transporter [Mycobacterium sp.]|nr:MFS transporter [Mycobacterium sp.]
MARSRITDWDPEDRAAWDRSNHAIARRNLFWLVVNAHITFSIWYLWSVLVLFMPRSVYGFSTGDKFLLIAVASLVGALVRIPYAFAANWFGGSTWTTLSSLVLLIPTGGTILLLAHPGWPLWPYLVSAALTGLAGGNYSASLAKADGLYPQRLEGFALGLTGGLANAGSAAIQAVGLLALAALGHRAPYWVCAIYLVLLAVGGAGAAVFMDDVVAHRSGLSLANLRAILPVPDTWLISFLYLCCSGSFLGFAFAFGQVLQHRFMAEGQSHALASLHAAQIAFTGPLVGSLARIAGGKLSDRFGGGPVILTLLCGMSLGGGFMAVFGAHHDVSRGRGGTAAMIGYVIGFTWLFVSSGAGKAAVYKLIPSVFAKASWTVGLDGRDRINWARVRAGALIGFAGAFGALGSVGINLALRQSYAATGSEAPAFWAFFGCYVVAAVLAWVRYVWQQAARVPATATDAQGGADAQATLRNP